MPSKKPQIVIKNSGRNPWIIKGLILLLLLVITLIAVLIGSNGSVSKATSRQDKPNTELYFSTTSSLVKKVVKGQKVAVPAVIANHEGRTITYNYVVSVAPKKNGHTGTAAQVQRSTITVEAGESAELPIDFSAPTTVGAYDVTVALEDRNEVIQYTMGVE